MAEADRDARGRRERGLVRGRVERRLRALLARGAGPGVRLPPVRELAARLDASVNTVRGVLLVLEREGLLHVRRGSGVYAAATPAAARRLAILCEYDLFHPGVSPFFLSLVGRLRRWGRERGLATQLYVGTCSAFEHAEDVTAPGFVEDAEAGRLVGVFSLSTILSDERVARLQARGLPVVANAEGPRLSRLGCGIVRVDTAAMVAAGVRALAAAGRRRIGLLGWGHRLALEDGPYAAEMRRLGLAVRPEWVCWDLPAELEGAGWEGLRAIWRASREKPDALLITDEELFRTAKIAVYELGLRVPEDLAIATVSNRGSEVPYPFPVDRMELDPGEIAAQMGRIMSEMLEGRPAPAEPVTVPYRFLPARPAARPAEARLEDRGR